MAQGGKAPATFEDGLNDLYSDVAHLALAPDAGPHMQFIQLMQKAVLGYRQVMQQQKAKQAAMGQGGGIPGMGGPPGGSPGGAPPGMGAGMGGPPGGPGGGPPPNAIAPGGGAGMSGYGGVANPEDLQRILSGTGGQ